MELIPVFAFIVLVASIATFIFSLAAYILYKIREKKGRYAFQPHAKAFKAEVISPNYYYLPQNEAVYDGGGKVTGNPLFDERHTNSNQDNFYRDENTPIEKKNGNEITWR
jgi:hypothetical protein